MDAWIHLDNHIPRRVVFNKPYRYELAPTTQRLRLLGSVEGQAVISEDPHSDLNLFGGCAPPYFVISDRLWVLEERITP